MSKKSTPAAVNHGQWLIEQLSRLADVKSLPRAKKTGLIASWKREHPVKEQKKWVEDVLRELELQVLPWTGQPDPSSLPMLMIMPGVGLCMVYAGGGDNDWLVCEPSGQQRLRHIPAGMHFIPIRGLEKKKSTSAAKLFKSIFFADRQWLIFAVIATIVGNLLALGVSLYSMQVYDRVIPTHGTSTLIVLTMAAGFAVTLELLLKLTRSVIVNSALNDIDVKLSHGLFERLLRIRMDQFPSSVGTLSGQLRGYETLRGFASTLTLYLIADAPFALLFLVAIFSIGGANIASVVLVFLAASIGVGLIFRRGIETAAKSGTGAANQKLGLLVETAEGAECIKSSGASWLFQSRWNRVAQEAIYQDGRVRKLSETASYIGASMQQLAYVGLIAAGAYFASDAHLTTGALVACSILSGRVLAPIGMLPGILVQSGHAKAAYKNLKAVFDLHADNHAVASPLIPESIAGGYTLHDVSFSYTADSPPISIKCLDVQPGEKIAILGTVGAGKSTLLRILAGIYQPKSGNVLLDGLDIQQISRARLSDEIGYLPQQISLFSGTLRDNLLLGLPGCRDSKILEAAKETGLLSVISKHPKGLDLPISEGGSGLSGGQRQLVALTRLLLEQPTLWLLDEPTASMDTTTEKRCLAALRKNIQKDHTAIFVTHKLALLSLVDRIVVMKSTGIALDGPRDVVLQKLRRKKPTVTHPTQHAKTTKPMPMMPIAFIRRPDGEERIH